MKTEQFFHKIYFSSLLFVSLFLIPLCVSAQDGQILSVTPPLFQLSALPGDVWQSSIKVVNGNQFPLTVYVEVVNFQATGEVGQGKFVPIVTDVDNEHRQLTSAEWIQISAGPHTIAPEQTKDVPFFVDIPKDAPPGGHYSAILITTEPHKNANEQMLVKTAQTVTTLFFVRIEGEVIEQADIREFSTTESFLEKPETEFILRFENKGNVHVQPRGNIIIRNMWGTERGDIPVNYQTHFGNVLPRSIREFKFVWSSDFNISDIGRYSAEVTLVYGDDEVRNVHAETHFWIIPLRATLLTLSIVIACIAVLVWMVRAYIRRMLSLAGVDVAQVHANQDSNQGTLTPGKGFTRKISYSHVSAPIKDGVLDLRKHLQTADSKISIITGVFRFLITYKKFFISIFILACMMSIFLWYMNMATEEHSRYRVHLEEERTEEITN